MKLGPVLLMNVALIALALFVYDSMNSSKRRPARSEEPVYDPLQADDLAIGDEPDYDADAPLLNAGGAELQVQGLLARIESLEGEISRLKRRNAAGGSSGGSSGGLASNGGEVPAVEVPDVGDLEDPVFDERALGSIEAYMDEINRRKAIERQRGRIDGQLTRLGLDISDAQREGVINETLAYQQRVAELYKAGWPKDDAGREDRREAFKVLRTEYESKIGGVVPADMAEKITSSRLGRSRGYVPNTNRGDRGGRNRKQNR